MTFDVVQVVVVRQYLISKSRVLLRPGLSHGVVAIIERERVYFPALPYPPWKMFGLVYGPVVCFSVGRIERAKFGHEAHQEHDEATERTRLLKLSWDKNRPFRGCRQWSVHLVDTWQQRLRCLSSSG